MNYIKNIYNLSGFNNFLHFLTQKFYSLDCCSPRKLNKSCELLYFYSKYYTKLVHRVYEGVFSAFWKTSAGCVLETGRLMAVNTTSAAATKKTLI